MVSRLKICDRGVRAGSCPIQPDNCALVNRRGRTSLLGRLTAPVARRKIYCDVHGVGVLEEDETVGQVQAGQVSRGLRCRGFGGWRCLRRPVQREHLFLDQVGVELRLHLVLFRQRCETFHEVLDLPDEFDLATAEGTAVMSAFSAILTNTTTGIT